MFGVSCQAHYDSFIAHADTGQAYNTQSIIHR